MISHKDQPDQIVLDTAKKAFKEMTLIQLLDLAAWITLAVNSNIKNQKSNGTKSVQQHPANET